MRFALPLLLVLLTGTAHAQSRFAPVGPTRDAKSLLELHIGAWSKDPDWVTLPDAVRGEPEAWVKDGPAHAFRKLDATRSVEVLQLPAGAHVVLVNSGWENYTVSLRYVFPTEAPELSPREQLLRAAEAMRLLRKAGARPAFDLGLAERFLRSQAKSPEALKPKDFQPVPGDGTDFLQTQIALDQAGVLSAQHAGYVEWTLTKGPL